eukprot:scaffold4958_cov406-Prasinococcus_capsulatus_cf.AAC.18
MYYTKSRWCCQLDPLTARAEAATQGPPHRCAPTPHQTPPPQASPRHPGGGCLGPPFGPRRGALPPGEEAVADVEAASAGANRGARARLRAGLHGSFLRAPAPSSVAWRPTCSRPRSISARIVRATCALWGLLQHRCSEERYLLSCAPVRRVIVTLPRKGRGSEHGRGHSRTFRV